MRRDVGARWGCMCVCGTFFKNDPWFYTPAPNSVCSTGVKKNNIEQN